MTLCCSYNLGNNNIKNYLRELNVSLGIYSSQYEHFIVMGDFNVEVENRDTAEFCKNYNLKSLIQVPKCCKSPKNPSCIDLIWNFQSVLYNRNCSFPFSQNDCNRYGTILPKTKAKSHTLQKP